jgi:calcineurin-like phosphoesterase family protein
VSIEFIIWPHNLTQPIEQQAQILDIRGTVSVNLHGHRHKFNEERKQVCYKPPPSAQISLSFVARLA